MGTSSPDVLVVLGCKLHRKRPSLALERRLLAAHRAHRTSPHLPIIMSGGRVWQGLTEAQAMAAWWRAQGKESELFEALLLENNSQNTRQNAYFVAGLCATHGYRHVLLVTCDYHLPRATRLFLRQGLLVSGLPAPTASPLWSRTRLRLREWGAACLERLGPDSR